MWRLAVGLLAGCCAVLYLPQALPVSVAWAALGTGAVVAGVARRAWLMGPGLGLWLTALHLQAGLDQRLDPALEGQPVRVHGVVTSVPQGTLQVLKFRFAPDNDARGPRLPPLLELTWYDAPSRIEAAERLDL